MPSLREFLDRKLQITHPQKWIKYLKYQSYIYDFT